MKALAGFVLMLFGLTCSTEPARPSAMALVDRLEQAMGGRDLFETKRYLRFDFVVTRNDTEVARHRHLWDRTSDRYRVQGISRDGRSYTVLFTDVKRKEGVAFVDGDSTSGDELTKWLEYGYGRFINDSYWLLMPWKLRDPGLHVEHRGADSTNGFQILHLTFDSVGLTPGDQYWVSMDSDSELVRKWNYTLQDGTKGTFDWTDWRTVDGLRFSFLKTSADRRRTIQTPVYFPGEVPDRIFMTHSTLLP